jgi:hypothetical protein
MTKYRVYGRVVGSKYLGVFDAENPEEAIEKALDENGCVSLCHRCVCECDEADIEECETEEVLDGEED